MSLTVPSERRRLPVRLTEIRCEERAAAARHAIRHGAGDPLELLHAALFPSDTVYWVALSAREQLERIAA